MFELYNLAGWSDVILSVLMALVVYLSACSIVKTERVCRMNKADKLKEWFYLHYYFFKHKWFIFIYSCILLFSSSIACLEIRNSIERESFVMMFYCLVILSSFLLELFYWPLFYFSVRKKYSKEIQEIEKL